MQATITASQASCYAGRGGKNKTEGLQYLELKGKFLLCSPRELLTLRRQLGQPVREAAGGFAEGHREPVKVSPRRLRSAARYWFSGSGWGSGASLLSKSMSESVWKMVDSAENLR